MKVEQWMEYFRQALLAAGFSQARQAPGNFYRPDAQWTAFAVNLRRREDALTVTFGYASTAFIRFAGDEDALILRGCDEITLCEQAAVRCDADVFVLDQRVRALLEAYRGAGKESLLAAAREKRKAFIALIAAHMKPLGFRKVQNSWKLQRPDGFEVELYLQKSRYADGYYFNLTLRPIGKAWNEICYETRIQRQGEQCLPWQELGEAAMTAFMTDRLMPAVRYLALTPLDKLARDPDIWLQCFCDRTRCDRCWL